MKEVGNREQFYKIGKTNKIYYKQCMRCLRYKDIPSALIEVKKYLRLYNIRPTVKDHVFDYSKIIYYEPSISECFEKLKEMCIRYDFECMKEIEAHEKSYNNT